MKIHDPHDVPPVSASSSRSASAPTEKQVLPDPVRRSTGTQALIDAAHNASNAARLQKLGNIAAAVRAGAYRPDPQLIADQILRAAELDAQLRAAMLGKE